MQVDPVRLSHWARVAFAANCARRVLPLFVEAWPYATLGRLTSVERAITLTEQSAAGQCACEGLENAVVDVLATAGRALLPHINPAPYELDDPSPTDEKAALIASIAAKVAVHAANAALSAPEASDQPTLEAFNDALSTIEAAGRPLLVELLESDFNVAASSQPRKPRWQSW